MQLKFDKDLDVPENFRSIFGRPPEVLITKESQIEFFQEKTLITVGDIVTRTALKFNIVPKISIVDMKTKRNEHVEDLPLRWDRVINVTNPPGKITVELWNAVEDSMKFKGKTLIKVDGEEDLASLPCIYFSPNGAIVIYGVPNKGIAVYEVGDPLRDMVFKTINEMRGDMK